MSFAEKLGGYEKKRNSQKVRKLEVFHSNHVRRPEIMRNNVVQETPHHERYG